jgi:hypothetical protein
MAISKSEKKKMCIGCRNSRYNMPAGFSERPGIDAPVEGTGCWNFSSAKIVMRRMVSYSQRPPWKQPKRKVLSCYTVDGYHFTDKEN